LAADCQIILDVAAARDEEMMELAVRGDN